MANLRVSTLPIALLLVTLHAQPPPAAQQSPATPQSAPAPQQSSEQPPAASQPTFRTEANYVRVDVYPTAGDAAVKDLRADDFEILEDDAPQKIATFEYVEVRPGAPQASRREPSSPRESNAMAADARARVIVVFLDTYHVSVESSHAMQGPLVELLDRVIGQDDLVGVMTPEMSAANLVLARRTTGIGEMLKTYWYWGRRDRQSDPDPKERLYDLCFPRDIAEEMLNRRREKLALDALGDLVRHLRGLRDERKAILVLSEGWRLFTPDQRLARPIGGDAPGTPDVQAGRNGRPGTTDDRNALGGGSRYECESDRLNLSMLNTEREFLDVLNDANRSNASFYPIDPRGLPAFDEPLRADRPPVPLSVDQARLRARQNNLRTLASATDGIAIVNRGDIEAALERLVADLTSYYLLGYYSTNTKLDGKFRTIKVRVKRPGVGVRARRGYRAPTAEDVSAARRSSTAAAAAPSAVSTAIADLGRIRPQARFRVHAAPVWFYDRATSAAESGVATAPAIRDVAIRVIGELDYVAARSPEWQEGAQVEITIDDRDGRTVGSRTAAVAPGGRQFLVDVTPGAPLDGTYTVRVRLRPAGGAGLPVSDVGRVTVPAISSRDVAVLGQPLVLRRGPTTGTRYEPTADLRFRRSDRLRLDVPVAGAVQGPTARLVDRNGQPMAVPVGTTTRQDPDGTRWIAAELAAAPLGVGDYAVEVNVDGQTGAKIVVGFRVVP